MTDTATRFDVIVVGGRPAGATLAARLGQAGVRVLLVDRATFPSLPAVSSPIIYPCTMALLDEIGADEAQYAHNTPKIRTVVIEGGEDYRAVAKVPNDRGRDYAYAIDRMRFDGALWALAMCQPNVTAYERFSALDLLWTDRRVVGIVGKPHDGPQREYYADVVVGADGQFSTVARKVNAPMYNIHEGRTTSLFYAYWRNLAPYDLCDPMMMTHGMGDGVGYLLLDSADGLTAVIVEGYTDVLEGFSKGAGEADAMYEAMLRHAPRIWERVNHAERVTNVRGLKHIANYYRQSAGPGWALVGDAVHHKDPLGGQGIYDAVFSSRAFAGAYLAYRAGAATWDKAMAVYKKTLEAETLPIYRNTINATSNFQPQDAVQRILGRYACENPEFIDAMIRVPARMIAPTEVVTTPRIVKIVARGVVGDVRRLMTGEPSPAAVPPLPSQRARGESTDSSASRLGCFGWLIAIPAIMALNVLFPLWRRRP
jgi:flavin-dependent dehydrogenase